LTEVCTWSDLKDESFPAVGRQIAFGVYPCKGILESIEM
jgi:hypothetical protein